jgi:ATP-dependent RNA helicase DeaD
MSFTDLAAPSFADFNLNQSLLQAVEDAGYESPTPIQSAMIPHVMTGRDVVGQAQTGTGKTAAFALPLLSRIDLNRKTPQVLVLTPTRELALQVSEAFSAYGAHLKKLRIAAIFGGQDYTVQLKELKRGPQVIVGTPGRVMDHIRRQSLAMDDIVSLVLDEADEMLNMGFIEDVEWVLKQMPSQRQVSLFSATMPAGIRTIAKKYLTDPVEIMIKSRTATAATIHQRYLITDGLARKMEALFRILESETTNGVLIFVRTKVQTVELSEKLAALGYAAAPLCGDIAQNQRLRTVEQLKNGKLDILVATDVAARGLDVERISHVINFDIPFDNEAYIHRIGRTGRAGRKGEAILFIHPREKKVLHAIETLTRQKIEPMPLPAADEINIKRMSAFKDRISETLGKEDVTFYQGLIEDYLHEHDVSASEVAAALARIVQGDTPFLLSETQVEKRFGKKAAQKTADAEKPKRGTGRKKGRAETEPMDRYRIEIGQNHGVKPGHIVGAIANEADIDGEYIGRISIFDDYSTVDLPWGMPDGILKILKKVRINERMLKISRLDAARHADKAAGPRKQAKVTIPKEPGKTRRRGQKNSALPPLSHS